MPTSFFTRKIDVAPSEDPEGLCYDLDRARREGLYETITFDPEQLMEAVLAADASVNVPPYTPQSFDVANLDSAPEVMVTYVYYYGSNHVPEVMHDGFGHTVVL